MIFMNDWDGQSCYEYYDQVDKIINKKGLTESFGTLIKSLTFCYFNSIHIEILLFSVTCLASKSVCAYISTEDLPEKYNGDGIEYLEFIASNKSGKEWFVRYLLAENVKTNPDNLNCDHMTYMGYFVLVVPQKG